MILKIPTVRFYPEASIFISDHPFHIYCKFLRTSSCSLCYPFPFHKIRLKEICPASFHETCQWLKFPLNGLPGPEEDKSRGRIGKFSIWTGMFRDGISSFPGETFIPL